MGAVAAGVAAGASIVGGIGAMDQNSKAAASASEAAQYKAAAAKIRNRQSKVSTQRQREMDIEKVIGGQSQLLTAAASEGNVTTSAYKGSSGALATQLKSNLGFGNQMQLLEDQIQEYENKAMEAANESQEHTSRANAYSALSGLSSQISGMAGGGGGAG